MPSGWAGLAASIVRGGQQQPQVQQRQQRSNEGDEARGVAAGAGPMGNTIAGQPQPALYTNPPHGHHHAHQQQHPHHPQHQLQQPYPGQQDDHKTPAGVGGLPVGPPDGAGELSSSLSGEIIITKYTDGSPAAYSSSVAGSMSAPWPANPPPSSSTSVSTSVKQQQQQQQRAPTGAGAAAVEHLQGTLAAGIAEADTATYPTTTSSSSSNGSTGGCGARRRRRPPHTRPLNRLSVQLIDTYKAINTQYYERKAQRQLQQQDEAAVSAAMSTSTSSSKQEQHVKRSSSGEGSAASTAAGALQHLAHPQKTADASLLSTAPLHAAPSMSYSSSHRQPPIAPAAAPAPTVGKGVYNNGWDDEHYDYLFERDELLQDRYLLKNRIGKGSFGQVVRGVDRATGREVAVKIIKSRKPFMLQAKTEVELLQTLRVKDKNDEFNLVRLQHHFIHRGHQCLVFEMLSYNLYDLLKYTKFAGVSLTLLRKFTKQILKALQFLARPDVDIIHCDLKPENILLRHPKRSGIKVIDFGSSCRSHKRMYSYIQSRFYRSPEVMLGLPYSVAIDMWSLGCVLVEMHTGEPLFGGVDQYDQMKRLVDILGLPPSSMLHAAPAASRDNFFELASNPSSFPSSTWRFKVPAPGTSSSSSSSSSSTPSNLPSSASPYAKLADILGVTTGGPSGRRANDPGHTVPHYQAFLDLILKMLHLDPAMRITPTEALRHPFLQAGDGGQGMGEGLGSTNKTEGGKEGRAQQPRSPRVTATTASVAHHGPPMPLLASSALDAGTQT